MKTNYQNKTCLFRALGLGLFLLVMGLSGCASLASRRGARMAPGDEAPKTGDFVSPLPGSRVISCFGPRRRNTHEGVDLQKSARGGDIVVAARGGTVETARRLKRYGLMVEILHPDGSRARYAHLKKILVKQNEEVEAGRKIGVVGATGNASAPHLHYEIRTALGHCVDPVPYMQAVAPGGRAARQTAASRRAVEGNAAPPGEAGRK